MQRCPERRWSTPDCGPTARGGEQRAESCIRYKKQYFKYYRTQGAGELVAGARADGSGLPSPIGPVTAPSSTATERVTLHGANDHGHDETLNLDTRLGGIKAEVDGFVPRPDPEGDPLSGEGLPELRYPS